MNESDNSWDQGVEPKVCQLSSVTPKHLLKILQLIKNTRVGSVKSRFSFGSESQLRKFKQLLEIEEMAQEEIKKPVQRESRKQKSEKGDFLTKKHHTLSMYSYVSAQIFLKHYSQKLLQLNKQHGIQFKQIGSDILISTQKSIGNMLKTQLTEMRSRIQVHIFYKNPQIFEIVNSSDKIRQKLKKVGIFSHLKRHRQKNPAFYSTQIGKEGARQYIRKEVLKQVSLKPKIIDLYDVGLSSLQNKTIFELLRKFIEPSVKQIQEIYEITLEINQARSCFVLHTQNQIFQQQPVALLSKKIFNLFFFSFPLKNARQYANQFSKQAKKKQFIKFDNLKRKFYFCVDRTLIKEKKIILQIFKKFLEQLSEKSQLIIHMYYHHLLVKNSTFSQQIIDLVHKNGLQITNMEAIYNKQCYNIVVKPKNSAGLRENLSKLKRTQMNFTNFLLKFLMLEEKEQIITEQELEWSIPQPTEEKQQKIKYKQKVQQQSNQSVDLTKSKTDNQSISKDETEYIVKQNSSIISNSYIVNQKSFQEEIGCSIYYKMEEPERCSNEQILLEKDKKNDKNLRDFLYENQSINFKCYKLKINYQKFKYSLQTQKMATDKAYLVEQILSQGKPLEQVKLKSFTSLKQNQEGYIIYFDESMNKFIPTHIIIRKG